MCGIGGFIGFQDDELIKKFSKELTHRGPDGEGFYIDKNISLLNRRLAIIDVKGGDQPIYNEDKSIVVVYNGEIYNYQEITKQLKKSGHIFQTKSDTEVIVHGYEKWGEGCFDRFNGMFAVALYDIKKKKLILARDHFGIKPLYFAMAKFDHETQSERKKTENIKLLFASEIKPLLYSGLIDKKPNDEIIYTYLNNRVHDHSKETFFKGVFRVMPGELLIVNLKNSNIESKKYTNIENDLLNSKASIQLNQNSIHSFKAELIRAIQYRLISEVPLGTCLSGGLDSSTVVTIVNFLLKKHVKESKSLGKEQNTFSAVFPGSSNDEEKYINDLITSLKSKIQCHKIYPKPEEFFKDLEDFVRTQEEPTISTGPYAQYKVMQKAHEYVTVLLDGQGSDEMMAGYLPYYFVYIKELWERQKYFYFFKEIYSARDIIWSIIRGRIVTMLGLKKLIPMSMLLKSEFSLAHKKSRFQVTSNNLKKRLVEDIFYHSLQSLLRYEDKNTMRFSIEGRVPFLDINLIRYIFKLENKAIVHYGWNKNILRLATKSFLPNTINLRRNKIGFTTPEYEWFLKMKNRIYSIFMSESFINRKYFNHQEVMKAFQLFVEGKFDDTMVFWRMMNIELWLREFIDLKSVIKSKSLKVNELGPNEGKKLDIKIDGRTYVRFPIHTELFQKGDEYVLKITNEISQFLLKFKKNQSLDLKNRNWFIVVSEKIIAISQGRSYFIWDIKPSFWANLLSKFVSRNPFGIGLGSPWTMQIAIQEVGLVKILYATIVSVLGKMFGVKGLFYTIAGDTVRSIDGPTEYSLYPSNVSAKLGPINPQETSEKIDNAIRNSYSQINPNISSKFDGVVIIDANDIGRNVLGNTTNLPNQQIEQIMQDNPMGQAGEQTPLVFVTEK